MVYPACFQRNYTELYSYPKFHRVFCTAAILCSGQLLSIIIYRLTIAILRFIMAMLGVTCT